MQKKNVYIFEQERDAIRFLRSYFANNTSYETRFFRKKSTLQKAMDKNAPDVLIVGAPECLEEVEPDKIPSRIVSIISADTARGLRAVAKKNIGTYITAPFYSEDLDYKLKYVCGGRLTRKALEVEKRDLETIVELAYLVTSTLDPREVLNIIVKKVNDTLDIARCSVITLAASEQKYASVVSSSDDPKVDSLRIELVKYPEIRKALDTKKSVFIQDALKDPLMRKVRKTIKPLGIKSIVVFPVLFRDEVVGTLLLRTSTAGHILTEREIRFSNAVANLSANALYNAFLYEKVSREKEELEKLAITDYLTGIYNIRYFYHRLDEEFSRAMRYKTALSCIMFDIDFFKKVNDTYGHRIGDMVLRELAQLVKGHTRKSDIVARYGGEEFILLLPNTPLKNAKIEAERLRQMVKAHRFESLGAKEVISISLGLTWCPNKKIKTREDLITLADDALYEAKAAGRDMLIVNE